MATLHTASVWGQGRAAATLSTLAGGVRHGEEECWVCRDDVPAVVAFQPCAHSVCFACVESMRAKNIFKVRRRRFSCCRLRLLPPEAAAACDCCRLRLLPPRPQAAQPAAGLRRWCCGVPPRHVRGP